MKFGVVNKSTTVNRFALHTLQRNITHLAVITRKTNIKPGFLKGGTGKEPRSGCVQGLKHSHLHNTDIRSFFYDWKRYSKSGFKSICFLEF